MSNGDQKLKDRIIKHIHLIIGALDETQKNSDLVLRFWTNSKSSMPDYMFRLILEPIKKRKGKNKKSEE